MVNVKKQNSQSSETFQRDELSEKEGKKASNQHLLTLAVAGLPGLRGPPRSAYTLELCDWLMSSCVELEGPWREALGTTGRLSECRVIRNPSFSLRCVNGPAASIWTSPEEGSPPSGWNWIVHRGGELWELSTGRGWGRKVMFLFIDSAAAITKQFQGRIKFGEFFP